MIKSIALIHSNSEILRNIKMDTKQTFEIHDSLYRIVFNDAVIGLLKEEEVTLDNTHFQTANVSYLLITEDRAEISRINVRNSTRETYSFTEFDSIEIHNKEDGSVHMIMDVDSDLVEGFTQIRLDEIVAERIKEAREDW